MTTLTARIGTNVITGRAPCILIRAAHFARLSTDNTQLARTGKQPCLRPTNTMISTEFGDIIADRMQAEHQVLAARWFERLVDLLPVAARDVFPTESLLDHIPDLIVEIGAYLRHPEADAIAANTEILEKARELG